MAETKWLTRTEADVAFLRASASDAVAAIEAEARKPVGVAPDRLTMNGHLYVHVAACPCPAIQAEVTRLAAGRPAENDDD